ncbi:hypothetical protein MRX96_013155 [Rhipicephalus microplus]
MGMRSAFRHRTALSGTKKKASRASSTDGDTQAAGDRTERKPRDDDNRASAPPSRRRWASSFTPTGTQAMALLPAIAAARRHTKLASSPLLSHPRTTNLLIHHRSNATSAPSHLCNCLTLLQYEKKK